MAKEGNFILAVMQSMRNGQMGGRRQAVALVVLNVSFRRGHEYESWNNFKVKFVF